MQRFTKIRFDGSEVDLEWTTKIDGVTTSTTLTSLEPPAPELLASLVAFRGYVLALLPLRVEEKDLDIRSLSLDEEPKSGKRGLVVSGIIKIADANDRPFVVNTPRLRDPADEEPRSGLYPEYVCDLIDAAERAAEAYRKGERGQTEIFTQAETTAAAPEKTNGTEPAKAPKVRRPRKLKEITEAGRVFNPEATIPPTDAQLRGQMAVSGIDVPESVIATWTSSQRDGAMKWACARDAVAVPPWVKAGASLDTWSAAAPVRLTSDDRQEIRAAIEAS